MNPKDQIKENLSITDVVSTYVRLEKSGGQFRARCPFHNEKTPSFYVSPERKSFHCFGCQVHGDIFTFVEKIENIPFYDALKILADRAGVSLKDAQKNKEESQLVSLLKDATAHFENTLEKSAEAKQYVDGRGLTCETLTTFHVGYAKNEWRDLFIALSQKGYTPEQMIEAGLVIEAKDDSGKTKGYYDRFRGRVMFPIRNVSGVTVGYSGRILPSVAVGTEGKYVNTPETPLYHKSKILFGYDTAKKMMQETKEVVVVEGQMDLCMSYQAGVHNTVAVSGTAFTDEHINLIKRFCDRVILSFDTDSAGQNAFKKTAMLCLHGGLDVYVVEQLGTKDPADLILENKDAWVAAVTKRRHVIEALLEVVLQEKDERERGRRVVVEILPFVRAIQSSVDRVYFLKKIAERTGITEQALQEELVRGIVHEPETVETSTRVALPAKERITRELVAFIKLKAKENDPEVLALTLDMEQFPEAIIGEEMFKLEERLHGNPDVYLKDLIGTYKREIKQEKIKDLQSKLKEEGTDHEAIMKELHELSRALP